MLVLANHGRRQRLAVNGVPVGQALDDIPLPGAPDTSGGAGATWLSSCSTSADSDGVPAAAGSEPASLLTLLEHQISRTHGEGAVASATGLACAQ